MTKPFFEVFPTLKIENPLHDRLEQASVERVSASKRRDSLHIYLFSTRLILKEDIRKAEEEIRKQLFPGIVISVKIQERFELSSQYTPENLMQLYRESILEELKDYSYVEYNAFRTAQIEYPDSGCIELTVDDTVPNRSKEAELVRVLEKILVERCGLSCGVRILYREAQSGKFAEDDELRIRLRVREISRRAGKSREEEGGMTREAGETGEGVSR